MKRLVPLTLVLFFALPVSAQKIDWGVWVSSATLQGNNEIDEVEDIEIELDENVGYGVSADIYWGDLVSTELAVYGLDADGAIRLGFLDEEIDLGSFEYTPITATVRAHFGSGALDFYIGAGAAHVLFDDFDSADLRELGTAPIAVDDETTWLGNIGLKWQFGSEFGLGVDAKWISLEADTVSATGEEITLELDPLVISAGFHLRL